MDRISSCTCDKHVNIDTSCGGLRTDKAWKNFPGLSMFDATDFIRAKDVEPRYI